MLWPSTFNVEELFMKVLWINPVFLDYRVSVYKELNELLGGALTVLYSADRTPMRVCKKVKGILGDSAIGLSGEKTLLLGQKGRGSCSFLNLSYQPGFWKQIGMIEHDVIITEGFFQWTPFALSKRIIQKTPLVLSYERTLHTERNCPWWRTQYRKICLRYIDSAICNGQLCKEYTQSLGLPADKIVTGGMAADSNWLKESVGSVSEGQKELLKKKHGLQGLVFLFVGGLFERKGIAELLQGWELYKNSKSGNGNLLLVGDGIQQEPLKQLVIDRGLPDVCFAGRVDYDSIAQYYAASDIFIMPTLEDNWSLVVPEAMACGLPVACSSYNGCWPELVKDGINGKVFDPHKPEDIANTLEYFANNANKLPEMGLKSQEIEEKFSPASAANAILEACNIAIASKK